MTLPALPAPGPGDRLVVLSGAGLSAASGIPTFRGADGLWEGHRWEDVATPAAWRRDPSLVQRFYDARRRAAEGAQPNAGHRALVDLQAGLGPARCALITQNVDGLLGRAGAIDVLEMHGALRRLRCGDDPRHPRVPVAGAQDPEAECGICGAPLRPDIVWFGETPIDLARIAAAVAACQWFLSVGTSGLVYPAAAYVELAASAGARCLEFNLVPSGAHVDHVIVGPAEETLPAFVRWFFGGTR